MEQHESEEQKYFKRIIREQRSYHFRGSSTFITLFRRLFDLSEENKIQTKPKTWQEAKEEIKKYKYTIASNSCNASSEVKSTKPKG